MFRRASTVLAKRISPRGVAMTKRRSFFNALYRIPNRIQEQAKEITAEAYGHSVDPSNHNLMHYKRGTSDIILNYFIYGLCSVGTLLALRGIFYEMPFGVSK
eukprot:scaffold7513_cov296-Pinguiococcus_pyrenoidosus.AAC.1